jgi:cbb3-type cytochrome oxidase subunit 1
LKAAQVAKFIRKLKKRNGSFANTAILWTYNSMDFVNAFVQHPTLIHFVPKACGVPPYSYGLGVMRLF